MYKLLCTFTDSVDCDQVIEKIKESYELPFGQIYKLSVGDEIILSYNVSANTTIEILPNTLLCHRKRETNTLYTINALNQLIINTINILDKSYQVEWIKYKNCIIMKRHHVLQINSMVLLDIIKIKK